MVENPTSVSNANQAAGLRTLDCDTDKVPPLLGKVPLTYGLNFIGSVITGASL